MNFSLVKAILSDTWSISLQYYLQFDKIADAILAGIQFEVDQDSIEPITQLFNLQSASYAQPGESSSSEGFVAVHAVRGVMLKYDTSCGPVGTRTIAQAILSADKNPEVTSHVVIFDTGGGQTTSVTPLREAFQKATKPVLAFVDGNMHSAGLFSAVFAKEIMALPGSMAGSIGTFIALEGMPKNHTAENGKVYRRIYATTSGKKNEEFEQALLGNDVPIQKNLLDPHDKQFMDAVKANRPNVTDEQLEGGIFQVENLIGTLIDSLGDLDQAIARAAELGKQQKSIHSNSHSNSNNMSKPDFKVLATAAGLESLEVADGGVFLSEDQATSVQTLLNQNTATIEAYSGLEEGETVAGLRQQINTLSGEKNTLADSNATLTAENERLSKNTVTPTGAGAEGDDDPDDQPTADAQAQHFFELSKIK